jgi:hypothetical protein
MPYVMEIRKFAAEIARHAEQRSVYLKHELADMTARRAEIEAHLHSTTVLQERLVRFQPEIGGSLQCPRCWVDRETRSSLTEAPSSEKEDSFRCQSAASTFRPIAEVINGQAAASGGRTIRWSRRRMGKQPGPGGFDAPANFRFS